MTTQEPIHFVEQKVNVGKQLQFQQQQQSLKQNLHQQSIDQKKNIQYQLLLHEETDQQYMRYCTQQQLINRLEYKFISLRFVFDLQQSILSKEKQKCIKQALPRSIKNNTNNIQINSTNNNNNTNKERFKTILIDDIFQQDINKLTTLKSQLQNSIKHIIKLFYLRKHNLQWIDNQCKLINQRVEIRVKSYSNKEKINNNSINNNKINEKTFQSYLSCAYEYLFVEVGDINMYNLLKQIAQRWIINKYKHQQLRCNNLLNQQQSKQEQKLNKLGINNKQQKQKQKINNILNSTVDTNLSINLVQQQQINISQAFLALLHQSRTIALGKILYSAATLPVDNFNKPCCTTFFYQFTTIPTNKLNTNKRNDHIIFITKTKDSQQQSNQQSFTTYQQPIKQSVAALLNNHGGFIFIGFKKQGLSYLPQSPFKISQNSIKIIRAKLQQIIGKQITLLTSKSDKQQIPYKKFHIDFIPIMKRMIKSKFNNDGKCYQGIGDKGDFVWRICIEGDNQNKLKIHSIGDAYYDYDKENERSVRLGDQGGEKDKIYKKLKQLLSSYGRYTKPQKPIILKYNPYKLINHCGTCQKPIDAYFASQCTQIDSISINITNNNSNKSSQSTTTLQQTMKKKQQKPLSKIQQLNNHIYQQMMMMKSNQYNNNNEESKIDFKQVNLIVLENKAIKQRCQAFFYQRKIQFKMQRIQSDYLKKLSKQTYIIYHHKKYDQVNNLLGQFKKEFNSKKNISLISAQKSVYVDGVLDSKKLLEIKGYCLKEMVNFQGQDISYVEQIKEKQQQRSYIKAMTKLGGIYLYFILTEMNLKPKMKNVPPNLQTHLLPIDHAISNKQIQQKNKNNTKDTNNNSNNNKGNNNKNNNKNNNNNNKINNNINNNNSNNQFNNNNNYIDPNYMQYRQYYLQKFTDRYYGYLNNFNDQKLATQQFYKSLCQNVNDWNCFWAYGINTQEMFTQINYMIQQSYTSSNTQINYQYS